MAVRDYPPSHDEMTSSNIPLTPRSPRSNVSGSYSSGLPLTPVSSSRASFTGPSTPNSASAATTFRSQLRPSLSRRQPRVANLSNIPEDTSMGGEGMTNGVSGSGQLAVRQEVWGTTVSLDEARAAFEEFFNEFKDTSVSTKPLMPMLLEDAISLSSGHINLNCAHLRSFNQHLYDQMITYPAELIPLFDLVIEGKRKEIVLRNRKERNANNNGTNGVDPLSDVTMSDSEAFDDLERPRQYIEVRPFNLSRSRSMRELNPEDIATLVSVKGMVIRCGPLLPDMHMAFFECEQCHHSTYSQIEDGVIHEGKRCTNCQADYTYRLVHNRCVFQDKQVIKVQETPDDIPDGDTPHSVRVWVYKDLVDSIKPGDRVEITGVFQAEAKRVNPRRTTVHTVYSNHLDAVHFKKTDGKRLAEEGEQLWASERNETDTTTDTLMDRKRRIQELAADPEVYARLVKSLAPSIYEMDDVKRGVLCQLFGGSGNDEGAGSGRFRGELNVLLCGDPGTSKSQLLQYVHTIAPRGIYTSGKGSSAVGLTASISRDPDSKELVLESGALVLSDRGICCIDEFDKMSDSTRSILHEVMEQQTVSIAKAGIVCTLNARTSILASANPKESRYNPNLSVVENIQIMPTLLSRFDLIFLVLDQPNDAKDRRLARHLVSMYFSEKERSKGTSTAALIPRELLAAYISYSRQHCRPKLSTEAQEKLIEGYCKLRRIGQVGANKVVTATPRQLEALVRLSEALARMQLSETVTGDHVMEARRLMDIATQSAATDPTTGRIDMDLLMTGHTTAERIREEHIMEEARALISKHGSRSIRFMALLEELNNQSDTTVTDDQLRAALNLLKAENFIVTVATKGTQGETIRRV